MDDQNVMDGILARVNARLAAKAQAQASGGGPRGGRFVTLAAKYDGTCRRCGEGFVAGTRIRYGGKGRTYHLAADCPASSSSDATLAGEANGGTMAVTYGSTVVGHVPAPADSVAARVARGEAVPISDVIAEQAAERAERERTGSARFNAAGAAARVAVKRAARLAEQVAASAVRDVLGVRP